MVAGWLREGMHTIASPTAPRFASPVNTSMLIKLGIPRPNVRAGSAPSISLDVGNTCRILITASQLLRSADFFRDDQADITCEFCTSLIGSNYFVDFVIIDSLSQLRQAPFPFFRVHFKKRRNITNDIPFLVAIRMVLSYP